MKKFFNWFAYPCGIVLLLLSCQDDNQQFGPVVAPSNLQVQVEQTVDGEGGVTVTATPTADDVLNFQISFGADDVVRTISPGNSVSRTFRQPGEFDIPISVVAFGTGGAASSTLVNAQFQVEFMINPETLALIAGDGTKRWIWDQNEPEHFGVGDPTLRFPNFFAASPNSLNPCLYDDVLTFSFDENNTTTYSIDTGVDNSLFINWAEINRFFPDASPQEFGDECRDILNQIQSETGFVVVPNDNGTGLILDVPGSFLSYVNGATSYEILELSENRLVVRSIQSPFLGGGDLAWYFTFIPEDFVPADSDPGFDTLIWADEFDVNGPPNPDNWSFDIGTGTNGWGNFELQFYTDRQENIEVRDGMLEITARRENFGGTDFTSSRIQTMDKFEFQFGRLEARIQLPTGVGTWPAFWTLGADILENPWPAAGEIDVMEHVGRLQDLIHGTTHDPTAFAGNGRTNSVVVPNVSNEFHVYAIEWTATEITWFVDGVQFHSVANNASLPFDKDFFVLLNFAMGGTFGGDVDPAFSQSTMLVDYVRVYQ